MRDSIRRALVVCAVTASGLALGAGPAAASDQASPSAIPQCVSPETRQAWIDWNEGGRELAQGAARMVSGAWIGAPRSILELASMQLSPETRQAWIDWNEGGGQVGHGAARMVSGAWIGAPRSILEMAAEDCG